MNTWAIGTIGGGGGGGGGEGGATASVSASNSGGAGGRLATGGGGGGGGGETSCSGSRFTLATPTVATEAPTAPAPHLLTGDTDGGVRNNVGATAARLASSSPSARFFASAWRSLHVNLPLEPPAGRGGADCAARAACARASNGLFSLFGGGRETGV
jgi:hypothetical protein